MSRVRPTVAAGTAAVPKAKAKAVLAEWKVPRGSHGPGFFSNDVAAALKARSEWAEKLPQGCLLRSDDLDSDQSDEWDGKDDDDHDHHHHHRHGHGAQGDAAANPTAVAAAARDPASELDEAPLNFADVQKRFANCDFETEENDNTIPEIPIFVKLPTNASGKTGESRGSIMTRGSAVSRVEPPARRLQRVRVEVEALCSWAEGRKSAAAPTGAGGGQSNSVAAQEAERLSAEVRTVAGLVQRAMSSNAASLAPDVVHKQMWLPPTANDDVQMLQHLVELNRRCGIEKDGAPDQKGQVSYSFSASMGQKGGWIAAAEAQALDELEVRIKEVAQTLGAAGAAGAGKSGQQGSSSLVSTVAQLHQRLDTLLHVQDEASCERLRTCVRLLSADIDVAIAEARHLEALEAEDAAAGDVLGSEDSYAQQVIRLHEQVAALSAAAARVPELRHQLDEQEPMYQELAHFVRDLTGAEAQAQHAAAMLEAAAAAAEEMKAAAQASREQLLKNIKALEARLDDWEGPSSGPSPPSRRTQVTSPPGRAAVRTVA